MIRLDDNIGRLSGNRMRSADYMSRCPRCKHSVPVYTSRSDQNIESTDLNRDRLVSNNPGSSHYKTRDSVNRWGAMPYKRRQSLTKVGKMPYTSAGASNTRGAMPFKPEGAPNTRGARPVKPGGTPDTRGEMPYKAGGKANTHGEMVNKPVGTFTNHSSSLTSLAHPLTAMPRGFAGSYLQSTGGAGPLAGSESTIISA